ncbi:hypothetical protein QJS10_CPA03g01235 [Acorus calamus]|uniref:Mitochondrial import inner membrane translocase subunit TIM50 n=1 Tax=Acorus calamus TaxID=4465 RepID=A0AAV9F912_ACOCL|nr:hypothetical protein QJS10_CPA03g01235 [Acorus calamus]
MEGGVDSGDGRGNGGGDVEGALSNLELTKNLNHWFKEGEGKQKVNHVTVFERPGLQEFLRQINEFADLVLFTAGLEGYARSLVDRIDAENRFILRLYRPATSSTEYREHVKDLSCLSKDLCRTVIVDKNPFSFLLQPLNGIPCIPFSAGQPYDEQSPKSEWVETYSSIWNDPR